jgi:mono/diheme cytochrome c family protein
MTTLRNTRALRCGLLFLSVTACSGGKDRPEAPATGSVTDTTPVAPTSSVAPAGETEYQRCVVCHQANGAGVPNAFPPLAGSEYVNGPAHRMVAIILHGLQGPITVAGGTYNGMMMPYGTGVAMTDDQVATVVTYVRSSFGNSGAAVTAADVVQVREKTKSRTTPWTVTELESIR